MCNDPLILAVGRNDQGIQRFLIRCRKVGYDFDIIDMFRNSICDKSLSSSGIRDQICLWKGQHTTDDGFRRSRWQSSTPNVCHPDLSTEFWELVSRPVAHVQGRCDTEFAHLTEVLLIMEVNMRIDQSREKDASLSVDHFSAIRVTPD
jgi:hypothetical protein